MFLNRARRGSDGPTGITTAVGIARSNSECRTRTRTAAVSCAVAICMTLVHPEGVRAVTTGQIEVAGDPLQSALPLTAFGATCLEKDRDGRIRFLKGAATTFGVVQVTKTGVDKWRPGIATRWPQRSGRSRRGASVRRPG